jgi:hypothetical protein
MFCTFVSVQTMIFTLQQNPLHSTKALNVHIAFGPEYYLTSWNANMLHLPIHYLLLFWFLFVRETVLEHCFGNCLYMITQGTKRFEI